ncbi:MAG: aspartate/glutamate racemase family protein [Humibacillus sp.]
MHVATFDDLVRRRLPQACTSHVVDEALLADARAHGPRAVANQVRDRIEELVAAGADIICCTCSTIGDVAEGSDAVVPVFRVDRPMAGRAVELGPRVGVVAALGSTLEPTRALLEGEAARVGVVVALELVTATGAWSRFERGDQQGYLADVAETACRLAPRVDVIVLAQASMAGAEPRLNGLGVPVLSSPRLAVEHFATRA